MLAPAASPRAIVFGGFRLAPRGLEITGTPEFGDFEQALKAATYLENQSPFWVADLLEYAKTRSDWNEFIDAVIDSDLFTKRTVDSYRHTARSVKAESRVDGLSFSHHAEVAALPSSKQREFLEQAKAEHWTTKELREAVRKDSRTRTIKGQAKAIAAAFDKLQATAWDAAAACKGITRDEGKHADQKIAEAHSHLLTCSILLAEWRKLTGTKTK